MDRALDLEGKGAAPGAESIYADADVFDSCEAASRKLKKLADADVPKSTLQRHCVRIDQEMQEFEPEASSADRILAGIDGTGVPMLASEGGRHGEDPRGESHCLCTAKSRNPTTGRLGGTGAAGHAASASTA